MMQNKNWQKTTDKDDLLVLVLRSDEEFKAIKNHWQELQDRAVGVGSSFRQAYKQWRLITKREKYDLLLITVWDGTLLVGVAPFCRKYFSSGFIGSSQQNNNIRTVLSDLIDNSLRYIIKDFSSISVDRSYLDLFSDVLMDILKPVKLGTNLLEFSKSDSYMNSHLYPKLRNQFATVD